MSGGSFVAPCEAACPAGVNVPGYVALASEGRFSEALSLIRRANPFPSVCSTICTRPCEAHCNRRFLDRAIAIRAVKHAVVTQANEPAEAYAVRGATGRRIAVIGGGARV